MPRFISASLSGCLFEHRDLAARQQQAATAFREVIRHSLAEDYTNTALLLVPSSPADDGVSPHVPKNPPQPADMLQRDGSSFDHQSPSGGSTAMIVSPEAEGQSGDRQNFDFIGAQSMRDQGGSDVKSNLDSSSRRPREVNKHDAGVLAPPYKKNSRGDDTKLELVYGHENEAGDEAAPTTATTVGAARALASDLRRLASRHGELAFEIFHVSKGHGPDRRSFAVIPGGMAALGQSVGLQASAVGLMEEVVVRTVHSRVRGGSVDCRCR